MGLRKGVVRGLSERLRWSEGGRERKTEWKMLTEGGCHLMVTTEILYESIVPPCLPALSWYGSLTIKPPPMSLDVALPLRSSGHTQDLLVCSRTGKAANRSPCRLHWAQGTHPSMAASATALAQQRREKISKEGDCSFLSCQCPDIWAQTDKQKTIFTFCCLIKSSHLAVC